MLWIGIKSTKKVYKGLRFTPTGSGFYPPSVKMFYNAEGEKYTKNVEKAKKLLDEAGLKDTDGDGLREDKMVKNLLSTSLSVTQVKTSTKH